MIEPENAEALVEAINRLAADRELGTALGQKGREHILRHFSRGSTAEKYIEFFKGCSRSREPSDAGTTTAYGCTA